MTIRRFFKKCDEFSICAATADEGDCYVDENSTIFQIVVKGTGRLGLPFTDECIPLNSKDILFDIKKYINKQKSGIPKQNVVSQAEFKRLADGYKNNKGQPASPAFYFGKYMSLLFLDTIKADTKNRQLDDFSKSIVRYAMSNTDISTFFIKVS